MSDGAIIVLTFFLVLSGWILIISISLRAVKRRLTKWDVNSYTWFIMSFGSFGQRQIDNWKNWGGYDEEQATVLVKYQTLCYVAIILWGVASMAAMMGYTALAHQHKKTLAEHKVEFSRAISTMTGNRASWL